MRREIPEYLANMVCRQAPVPEVVHGTTPVSSFGDPRHAEVATLGINPSGKEFQEKGRLLAGRQRRLATLESLGARSTSRLTDRQIRTVIQECASYFREGRNPYRLWFDPLDRVLQTGLGVSYYDGSACHLDLVQWATDPVWGKLRDRNVKRALLEEGLPHLRNQLKFAKIRLVVLNGREVLNQVAAVGLADLSSCGTLRVGTLPCSLYAGEGGGARFIGWSTNLQSTHGVTLEFRSQLANWLAAAQRGKGKMQNNPDASKEIPPPAIQASAAKFPNGYIPIPTQVAGKFELLRLLMDWLNESSARTIGDFGDFGKIPCILIALDGGVTAKLHADTKRDAVKEYVEDARARGADAAWTVVANRDGPANKLVFREDSAKTRGWYCYSQQPLSIGRKV
ncbi:MAG: hypothetical protein ACLQBA_18280 [Candidatus Binataceae bacterium]